MASLSQQEYIEKEFIETALGENDIVGKAFAIIQKSKHRFKCSDSEWVYIVPTCTPEGTHDKVYIIVTGEPCEYALLMSDINIRDTVHYSSKRISMSYDILIFENLDPFRCDIETTLSIYDTDSPPEQYDNKSGFINLYNFIKSGKFNDEHFEALVGECGGYDEKGRRWDNLITQYHECIQQDTSVYSYHGSLKAVMIYIHEFTSNSVVIMNCKHPCVRLKSGNFVEIIVIGGYTTREARTLTNEKLYKSRCEQDFETLKDSIMSIWSG